MNRRPLGRSELVIEPLVLGGNVFGWTVDEARGFDILDAYVGAGFSAIDTAEGYPNWVPGNPPGMSETIIGKWLKARGNRDSVHIFTKVNSGKKPGGLKPEAIKTGIEASLKRLQTDYVDLYFSHWPDAESSHEESLEAYDTLIRAGKVRVIGASNYDADMMREAQQTAIVKSLQRYEVTQPRYNLYDRAEFDALRPYLLENELGSIVYFSLASGFLTGKYRSQDDLEQATRGGSVGQYLNAKGLSILGALDQVATELDATPAEIALAWLVAQPGVSAPIASATSIEQVETLARGVRLKLSAEAEKLLNDSGR
ncbi:aryl-alcohol dehydrogenase-like predicted oxidoreductase [Devosia subaequoris]|uniref:Aryl-alcohol dehydrogenase-like predicted oxidoreductase n=1 Tax=Devosia subaequoris TaxID=395930 RepID=A0A7W6INY1_9HYPH|nr:aldo/keto reductase [Devosia subaequoris]MBB4053048.1 aryl-alcohol dehydrogenase-like predicted oxidoreductase [Devosia subaequoris]MCP1210465.1 aldo/keto reductase [Devosia subaequoris]